MRPKTEQKLSKRSTCLFAAFAQYLTDGFIRTRLNGENEPDSLRLQNTSNHDIDMCPLYGRTKEQTDALRRNSKADGEKGQLLSWKTQDGEEYAPFLLDDDEIIERYQSLDPPLGMSKLEAAQRACLFAFGGDRTNASPQVAMINTLFLREHNRLAREIEKANPEWDDERVFQTARNTVIVIFIKIVVEEYINHISPTIRFHVDPSVAWSAAWNHPNWITTEFSLLYRWHPLVPDTMRWAGRNFPVHATLMDNRLLLSVGLRRAFEEQSAQATGELTAANTSQDLRDREVQAIRQGRLCLLPSYAAYREYVQLPKPKSFEEISRDPAVQELLKSAYETPDEVEFYPGLFAEDNDSESPLPPLMRKMVAIDAFSQALTNPLLAETIFNCGTFSKVGWDAIHATSSLEEIVDRNIPSNGKSKDAPPIRMSFTDVHRPHEMPEIPIRTLGDARAMQRAGSSLS